MGRVHDDAGVARGGKAGLVEGVGGSLEVGVAVDLDLKREVRSVTAHVASLVVHDNTEARVVLADKRKSTGLLLTILNNLGQVIASSHSVDDVRVIWHEIRAETDRLREQNELEGE